MFCLLRVLDRRTERHIIFAAACAQSTPPSLGEGMGVGRRGAGGGSSPLNLPYSIGPQILIAARELMLSEPSPAVCR